jgi:hypothetical protein
VADLKSKQIRDSYDDLLTKGSGNQIEDGDGVLFKDLDDYLAKTGGNLTGLLRATAGINFNASGGDTFSNYTVGLFTPFYKPSTGSFTSVTYISQDGFFIRKGSEVTVTGRIRTTAVDKGTASGNVDLAGMPFPSANVSGYRASGSIADISGWENKPSRLLVRQNFSELVLQKQANINASTATIGVADMSTTTNDIVFAITYQIA